MTATTCDRCGEGIADGARVWVESETPEAADICRARLCPPFAKPAPRLPPRRTGMTGTAAALNLSESEQMERNRRINAALAEAGFPGATHPYGGMKREDIPPALVYRAVVLALPEVRHVLTFDQWMADRLTEAPMFWARYFSRHGVEVPA